MKINKENIEEVIFDFHEGNLEDVEKAELMDFLHKYPEYEKEFVLWAKTYHADKQLLDYGNDERFVKKSYSFPVKWAAFVGGCLLAGVTYWWTLDKGQEKEIAPVVEQTAPSLEKTQTPTLAPLGTISKIKKSTATVRRPNPEEAILKEEAEIVHVEKADTLLVSSTEVPVALHPDSLVARKEPIANPLVIPEKKAPREDSIPSLKKTKKHRKLDLTPSNHILPFNTDL